MTRVSLAFLLLFALPATPQDLSSANLDRLKAATVFVQVETAYGRASGTGLLFLLRGSGGYLMTCAHVVNGAEEAEVVFQSGEKGEVSYKSKVIASDPERDLACLLVKDAKGLPAPLDLGEKTTVRETATVYVAGFPFGVALAMGNKNPEMSINKVQVSSIRKDEHDAVALIQLAGEINPGNSGGPVVDANLKVVGVAQSKIGLTQTCFAVPPEAMQAFLKGRVRGSVLKLVSSNAAFAKYEVILELVDPLSTLKDVGISYLWEDQLKTQAKAEADGTWKRASPQMKELALRVAEGSATGMIEFTRAPSEPENRVLLFQIHYTRADGTTHWTAPTVNHVNFAANAGANPPAQPGAPPSAQGKPPADVPEQPPVKGVDLVTSDEPKALASLPLNSVITGLHLTRDGQFLYALDLAEGKVYKIDAATLKVAIELPLPANTMAMCLTPNEETIYVAEQVKLPSTDCVGGTGSLQVISARDLKVESTLPIDSCPMHLDATDRGIIMVIGGDQWNGTIIVDVLKKSRGEPVRSVYANSFVHLAPDQSRFYLSQTQCVPLQKDSERGWLVIDSHQDVQVNTYGEFAISPDGCFLISSMGAVLRLSMTQPSYTKRVGRVEPFVSIAMASGCNTFFVGTKEGFLKQYSLDSLELKKSIKVNGVCTCLALDSRKSVLYAHVARTIVEQVNRPSQTSVGVGNIASWSLSGK